MKINRLYLQNFRSHRESDISLDRVNFFLGKNNAGKTSLLAALEWGLTGRCYWTDKAGRGAGDLIKTGAKSATVLADLAGAGLAVRTMNPNGFTFDGETGAQAAQAKLYAALQTNEDDLRAALNVSAFLAMSPAEQKTYLFNVLNLRWDIDTVLGALREWANRSGHGEKIERLEHLVRPLYPPKIQAGPEVLDAIEKKLRDLRRDTKRDLQRIRAAQEENPVTNPAPDVTLEEVLAQLAELRAERDNILTMLADRKRSEDRRKALQTNYEAVRGRLSQITDALAGLAGLAPVKPFAVPDRAALDGAAALVAKRQAGVVSLEAEWRTLKAALDALSKAGSRCPLAPDHITCAMTTAKRIKLLEDLAAQADAKADAVEQARLELDQARRENERQKTFAEQARQAERAAQEAEREKARLQAQAGELSRQAEDLAAELLKYEALQAPDLSPLKALDERIAKGEALADKMKAYQQAKAQADTFDRDTVTLTAELAEYDLLVKAFGPDGIRRCVLANSLEQFTARVNANLAGLTDGEYTVEFAPDMSPTVKHAGAVVPARLLSTSEQLRVGIAVQEAIAAYLGLRILAIDGADLLDQDNRDRLTGFVLERAGEGEFEQVLVFSTVGDVQPVNPGLPGFKLFWVEAGTVKEI